MKAPQPTKNLQLALVGLDPPIAISDFDNSSGVLSSSVSVLGLREGAILSSDGKALWGGIVRINVGGTFDLCVSPAPTSSKDEVIPWKDLPPFFTVFDGGYESLGEESVNTLLDDLITFNDLVKVRCHFELNGKQESIFGKWGDQENLKTLSEILIDWNFSQSLDPQQLVLLEVELFETVYFVIAIKEECDDRGIVLSLTSHFYQQRNRIGRRIPIEPIEIDGLKILEVSDFGMKVSSKSASAVDSSELVITINGCKLLFGVTYKTKVSPEEIQMGLSIQDHSPEARKAWQGFLLKHQYPLLSKRDESKHEQVWNLLKQSGYFNDPVGEMVSSCKQDILNEWGIVDGAGPDYGTTVYSSNSSNDSLVSTIGVSRASSKMWLAQAAAMIDKPEFMSHSASVYSWRTRNILQQIDGECHLAFFAAHKPFLDRFFRKFLLKTDENKKHLITWDEWLPHFCVLNGASQISTNAMTELAFTNYLKDLTSEHSASVQCGKVGNCMIVKSRPHQHLAQFLSSIWCKDMPESEELNGAIGVLSKGANGFILIMSKKSLTGLSMELGKIHVAPAETVWTCKRALLPDFLSNSLRALEIMHKKYSVRKTA